MEVYMKVITTILSGLILAGALAATPASARVCLNTRDITGSNSKDGKTLDFTMRDGTMYRNHLQGICTDLKFEGFVWVIHGPEEVCENMQSLKVINSGQVCVLGKFDPPVPKATKPM
jgi:hypothetical protein